MEEIKPNPIEFLNLIPRQPLQWVKEDTAILVVHGIGNQLPLETLDQFGQGLIAVFRKEFPDLIKISHQVVDKKDSRKGFWFDNVLRIQKEGSESVIDIYEYYWANYTEGKASWGDINSWLQGVVGGAKEFYNRNQSMGQQYKDKSIFFDDKTGAFNKFTYDIFISTMSKILLTLDAIWSGVLWLLTWIPFFGNLAKKWVESYTDNLVSKLTNVLGDVVVYNVNDPKSKFYGPKKRIQEGAVKSLLFILERQKNDNPFYSSVLVAGHSLGSQVAYDAINKINLLINQGLVVGYDQQGINQKTQQHISTHLRGFITFGCPLDKIVFFLRDNVPDNQYIRQQFLDHFNGFKQRDINFINKNGNYVKANSGLKRHFEEIQWRNYFDNHDYVSGGLDYYHNLTNVDCGFKAGKFSFTHSEYWTHEKFYNDVVFRFFN